MSTTGPWIGERVACDAGKTCCSLMVGCREEAAIGGTLVTGLTAIMTGWGSTGVWLRGLARNSWSIGNGFPVLAEAVAVRSAKLTMSTTSDGVSRATAAGADNGSDPGCADEGDPTGGIGTFCSERICCS